jgi:hypothetical protein
MTPAMPGWWRCWRCGGQHPLDVQRCPNASPTDDPPTRAAMLARAKVFLERYAASCEARGDTRRRVVRFVGEVSMAEAVRMEIAP